MYPFPTRSNVYDVPFLLRTDSYKGGHFFMLNEADEFSAYMEARGPLPEVTNDHRIVASGFRYIFDTLISRRITQQDIDEADYVWKDHHVGSQPYMWPRELFQRVVNEGGYLPFKIQMVRDGSVVYPHVPLLQIQAADGFEDLITYFEGTWTHAWSATTTATKSRIVYQYLREKFKNSVEDDLMFLLRSRLHDFGYRGVSSVETAMVTGLAHLLTFEGTDTLPAAWIGKRWNNDKPVGFSVYASEHSVMTSYFSDYEAMRAILKKLPENCICSFVADSRDYDECLRNLPPDIVRLAKQKNILFVARPDSGDPIACVENGLHYLKKHFGFRVNSKGFMVLDGAAVIQGDGIDITELFRIADAVESMQFSAQNVAYGMGGGLLQKQNRDSLKVASKVSERVLNNIRYDIRKTPKTDPLKNSLPGRLTVYNRGNGISVYPETSSTWRDHIIDTHNLLETVWDFGPVEYKFEDFSEMRERLDREWDARPSWYPHVLSDELKEKIVNFGK